MAETKMLVLVLCIVTHLPADRAVRGCDNGVLALYASRRKQATIIPMVVDCRGCAIGDAGDKCEPANHAINSR